MRQPSNARLLNLLTAAMTIAALAAVGAWLWQSGHSRPSAPPASLQRIPDWREYATGGIGEGEGDAAVAVVMFSDYQCPFCSAAFSDLEKLANDSPKLLRVIYRNYPLRIHPAAMAAAQSGICANEQHAFRRYSQLLFSNQNSTEAK